MTLDEYLLTQSKEELIEIYRTAMDLMQQWNGRSYTYCVIIALGGTAEEQDNGTYKYSLPKEPEEHAYNVCFTRTGYCEVIATSSGEAAKIVKEMYLSGDACAELDDPTYAIVGKRELD